MDAGETVPKTEEFAVVINDEDQYSIWSARSEPPAGWQVVKVASREECLSYISEVWTDMRPRSLREAMQSQEKTTNASA